MKRSVVIPLTAVTLALAGCSSGGDSTPPEPDNIGSDTEPSINDDPLMACYGLVGLGETQYCIPGVGAISPQDVRLQIPEFAEVPTKSFSSQPVTPKTSDLYLDGRWLRAFMQTYRMRSHGTTPESQGSRVEIYDVATRERVSGVDLDQTYVDNIVADPANNQFVAILTNPDATKLRNAKSTLAAIDPTSGSLRWTQTGLTTSGPGRDVESGLLPMAGYNLAGSCGANYPERILALDTKSGEPRWERRTSDYRAPNPRSIGERKCSQDAVVAPNGLPFLQVIRNQLPGTPSNSDLNVTTNVSIANGNEFATLPTAVVLGAYPKNGTAPDWDGFVDSDSSLAIVHTQEPGGGITRTGASEWVVFDRKTGEAVYRLPDAQLEAIDAKVVGLFDSKIYLRNATVFMLDARTGAEAGSASAVPLGSMNGWVLDDSGQWHKSE